MHSLDNLALLTLAALEGQESPVSRYEIMALVNEMARQIDRPYSPGAAYHCIKQLIAKNMINFNHDLISLGSEGRSRLENALLLSPVPESIAGMLCRILSLQLVCDPELRKNGYQRLNVEMIKINQNGKKSAHLSPAHKSAMTICRKELGLALNRIVLELGA